MTKIAALANISYALGNGNTVVNGYKLSQIGLQLGTTAASQSNLYLESAFQSVGCCRPGWGVETGSGSGSGVRVWSQDPGS